jgi:class 3 adenylate cyclase
LFIDIFEDTTILFADIKGFTEYSAKCKSPAEVVKMLKNLFIEFDKMCIVHNVYKVYTIGDCYVVLGFTDANKRVFELI